MKLILFPIDSKSTSPHDSNNNATRTQWQELSPLSMMETITRAAKAKAKAREAHVSHPRTVSTDSDSILHTSAMWPLSSDSDSDSDSSSFLCTAMPPLGVVRADRPDDEMDLLTFFQLRIQPYKEYPTSYKIRKPVLMTKLRAKKLPMEDILLFTAKWAR